MEHWNGLAFNDNIYELLWYKSKYIIFITANSLVILTKKYTGVWNKRYLLFIELLDDAMQCNTPTQTTVTFYHGASKKEFDKKYFIYI